MGRFSLYAEKVMKLTTIKNFKKTLSKFTTGVTVVCIENNGKIIGKTVNSFNSLSLNPPLILFSLGNYSSSIKSFLNSKYLTINILSKKQKNISNHFSKKKQDNKKIEFIKNDFNTFFIPGCIGYLQCKLVDKIKKGDHFIFVCKVIKVSSNDKLKPLSYYNSTYI